MMAEIAAEELFSALIILRRTLSAARVSVDTEKQRGQQGEMQRSA
jgi:hypothetical protein